MKKLGVFVRYWFPLFIWMAVIFYFSSRPRVPVTDSYTISFIFFKSLHIIEYAFLYLLLFRAFNYKKQKTKPFMQSFTIPLLIGILYAASDEIHQTFVPTREGRPRDVMIDTLGMSLMLTFIYYNFKRIKRYLFI